MAWDPHAVRRVRRPPGPAVRRPARPGARRPSRRSWSTSAAAPGELTLGLAERWPRRPGGRRRLLAADAGPRGGARPERAGSSGCEADVADWEPARGARSTSWSPTPPCSGCPATSTCCPRWVEALAPGGWFALQVPGNFDAPSHALLREVAAPPAAGRRADAAAARRLGRRATPARTPRAGRARLRRSTCGRRRTCTCWTPRRPGVAGARVGRGTALRPVLDVLTDDDERAGVPRRRTRERARRRLPAGESARRRPRFRRDLRRSAPQAPADAGAAPAQQSSARVGLASSAGQAVPGEVDQVRGDLVLAWACARRATTGRSARPCRRASGRTSARAWGRSRARLNSAARMCSTWRGDVADQRGERCRSTEPTGRVADQDAEAVGGRPRCSRAAPAPPARAARAGAPRGQRAGDRVEQRAGSRGRRRRRTGPPCRRSARRRPAWRRRPWRRSPRRWCRRSPRSANSCRPMSSSCSRRSLPVIRTAAVGCGLPGCVTVHRRGRRPRRSAGAPRRRADSAASRDAAWRRAAPRPASARRCAQPQLLEHQISGR